MGTYLITGGSGFFGGLLKERLLELGHYCVNIDLEKDDYSHHKLESIQGDIRNKNTLDELFSKNKFDAVFHCAAILAHVKKNKKFLWESNVDGTKNVAYFAKKYGVAKVIFISSNCLWAHNFNRAVVEDDTPEPVEIYGKSKWEGEKILLDYKNDFHSIIFRCPTIIDAGRLGLLTILFEFIDAGKKVWVVGDGSNKYQFIYAKDLINACILALGYNKTDIFNIGSDNVKTFREVYQYVIDKAKTGAKITQFPKNIIIPVMKAAYFFGISPLGPYQYKMIAEDFIFATTKIKKELNWSPTLTNEEMLLTSYKYYHDHINEIKRRRSMSAHKSAAKMGVIKLLKWLS